MSPVFPLGAIALLFLAPARLLPAASPEAPGAFAPPRHCAPPGDGGATWREVLVVDPDAGGPLRAFDPELWLAPDGLIRVVYDHDRRGNREILMATFREDDATAGRPASGEALLRQLVSKGSGGVEQPKRATRAATHKRVSSEAAPAGLSPR